MNLNQTRSGGSEGRDAKQSLTSLLNDPVPEAFHVKSGKQA